MPFAPEIHFRSNSIKKSDNSSSPKRQKSKKRGLLSSLTGIPVDNTITMDGLTEGEKFEDEIT